MVRWFLVDRLWLADEQYLLCIPSNVSPFLSEKKKAIVPLLWSGGY